MSNLSLIAGTIYKIVLMSTTTTQYFKEWFLKFYSQLHILLLNRDPLGVNSTQVCVYQTLINIIFKKKEETYFQKTRAIKASAASCSACNALL